MRELPPSQKLPGAPQFAHARQNPAGSMPPLAFPCQTRRAPATLPEEFLFPVSHPALQSYISPLPSSPSGQLLSERFQHQSCHSTVNHGCFNTSWLYHIHPCLQGHTLILVVSFNPTAFSSWRGKGHPAVGISALPH